MLKQKILTNLSMLFLYSEKSLTPPKTNMEPENDGLEDDFPLPGVSFSGSMLIFWGVCFSLKLHRFGQRYLNLMPPGTSPRSAMKHCLHGPWHPWLACEDPRFQISIGGFLPSLDIAH